MWHGWMRTPQRSDFRGMNIFAGGSSRRLAVVTALSLSLTSSDLPKDSAVLQMRR
jgi:hypothetical protein